MINIYHFLASKLQIFHLNISMHLNVNIYDGPLIDENFLLTNIPRELTLSSFQCVFVDYGNDRLNYLVINYNTTQFKVSNEHEVDLNVKTSFSITENNCEFQNFCRYMVCINININVLLKSNEFIYLMNISLNKSVLQPYLEKGSTYFRGFA